MLRRTGVTIKDVALKAGVSKATAASILRAAPGQNFSHHTRTRVMDAAAELGYQRNELAAALSSGRAQAVGVLLPLRPSPITEPMGRIYGQDVFLSVFKAASRAGLRVTPVPLTFGQPVTLWDVTDRRVDGLIMASMQDGAFVRSVYESGMPCVEIGSGYGERLIRADNEGGAALAVEHLADLGHRRIAYWFGDAAERTDGHKGSAGARRDGFLRAAAARGLEPATTPVLTTLTAVREALARPDASRPTAVVAFNDYQATVLLGLARERGLRVPEDLSVVGFDNNILAEAAWPALTTVHNPLDELADAAIKILHTLWTGTDIPPSIPPVPTHLVVRHSTAPPVC